MLTGNGEIITSGIVGCAGEENDRRSLAAEFVRYFGASLVALLVDVGLLWLLVQTIHYLWAASVGFIAGALVSYWLATRWAFCRRRLHGKASMELAAYVLIGVLGLAVNNLMIFLAIEAFLLPVLLAKMLAAVGTFTFNFVARKLILF